MSGLINEANTLELHYWFKDKSHTMDAVIQNKCEYELLNIFKEIAKIYDIEITIETEPLGEGGIKRWFKVLRKNENKNPHITIAVIILLITHLIATPLGTPLNILMENLFKDKEMSQLKKEKIRLEINNIELEIELKKQQIESNNKINKRKSNFYIALENVDKLDKVSFNIQDEIKNSITKEWIVNKKDFKNFILSTNELEPENIEEAVIEIISPVLKQGNYKWKGIFNGDTISFYMKSDEFKNLIQCGNIEFKNGSSIKCNLEIERKLDDNGNELITQYNILRVDEYFENDKPIETLEGRKHRQKKEADRNQLKLFDDSY